MVIRVYGIRFQTGMQEIIRICKLIVMLLFIFVPYQYVETIIKNLSSKQFIKVAEMNKEIENVKGFLEDQNSLLQSLEEGIVVVKKNHIDFINDIFCDII